MAVEDALYHQARYAPSLLMSHFSRHLVELSCFLNPFLDRDVQGREFEEWVASVRKTLELNDRGSNCVTLLRQLFVLNAVTKYPRK